MAPMSRFLRRQESVEDKSDWPLSVGNVKQMPAVLEEVRSRISGSAGKRFRVYCVPLCYLERFWISAMAVACPGEVSLKPFFPLPTIRRSERKLLKRALIVGAVLPIHSESCEEVAGSGCLL